MRDLLSVPMFADIAQRLQRMADRISNAPSLNLQAPASLNGVLAMGQLEAACLDAGLMYSRRFYSPKSHRPRDEPPSIVTTSNALTVALMAEEATWVADDVASEDMVRLVPLATSVMTGSTNKHHLGAVDVVAQAAALGALLAPNGRRVRTFRPMASLGMWLGGSLDTSMDVFHNLLVHHLNEEGTLRLVPLPEVEEPKAGMLPNISDRRVKKLAKAWPRMNVEDRAQAMSELTLPCLSNTTLSTPRLESLVWCRMLVGDSPVDLASQLGHMHDAWPGSEAEQKQHASTVLDGWLASGMLWSLPATD